MLMSQVVADGIADMLAKLQKASFAAGLGAILREHGFGASRPVAAGADEPVPDWEDDAKTWEERFIAFYSTHAPETVGRVPALLEKYAGREHVPYLAMLHKYNVEPHPRTQAPMALRRAPVDVEV